MVEPENARPIAWANLFGGPGTGREGLPNRGTITRVANNPMMLRVGPVVTLQESRKPRALAITDSRLLCWRETVPSPYQRLVGLKSHLPDSES